MKIVDVSSFYSSTGGGIRTYLRGKARALVAAGHAIARVVPGARNGVTLADDGAEEHTVRGPRLPMDPSYRLFGDWPELVRVLRRLEPDVIEVASHYVLPYLVDAFAPQRARVVGYFHANPADTFVARDRFPRLHDAAWRLVRGVHRRYDATLCASRAVQARLLERGVPRVFRVGLGVDLARFAVRSSFASTGRACYVGRLGRDKETALLLAAAPLLARAGVALRVAGDGPATPAVQRCAALEYVGPVDVDGVRALLHDSDVCVVPSRYETFSLVTAEALACGTEVVCPAGGAADELRSAAGVGEAFLPGSAQELARAVWRVCRHTTAARAQAAQRARALAERALGWDHVATRLIAAYRGAVAREAA